jgi:RIO-like serine/threonine protein kinase
MPPRKAKTCQYQSTMSINRDRFMAMVVTNKDLSKKDLRVLMHLMTHLDSIEFKAISVERIAETLKMKDDDVRRSLSNLYCENIIDYGDSDKVSDGLILRF